MPRVLIVSPHFPPASTPDMHRVRTLLPFLHENGWEVTVLAVQPGQVAAPQDQWLESGLPEDVPIIRCKALSLGWSRIPGFGSLGFRALPALAKTGDRLLSSGGFDLVYFSTTAFEVHILGPRWKRRYGVPFAMDYQDPWVNDYYYEHPEIVPPGGRLKYGLADKLHRFMEPRVLRDCSGITSVSPDYPKQLAKRYPWLGSLPNLIMPFPAAKCDFERLSESHITQQIFNPKDGCVHWVYTGVVIPGMLPALRGFFKAIATGLEDDFRKRLRLHFIGTSYTQREQAASLLLPLAAEYGLSCQLHEECGRIPYAQALKCLTDADALIAVGSDDPTYTASKIYPYLLARKPLLAIFHENSSVVQLLYKVGGGVCVTFDEKIKPDKIASSIKNAWLRQDQFTQLVLLNLNAFEAYSALGQARKLTEWFDFLWDSNG